jgi:hypothetical protein
MAETAAAYIFKVVASSAIKAGASEAAAAFLAKSAVFAAKVGLTVGASAALNAAFAPRVSTPDSRIAQRQPTPERTAAFGRVRSAGAYTLYSTSGGDSIDVLAFHDGRIAGIDQIYLHDDLVSLGTGPLGAGFVLGDSRTDQYFEAIYIDTRLGTESQTAFTRAAGKVPGEWTSQHCMDGVAALELLCLGPKKERLPKVYPLGLPRPSVVYRAQYCFDFRQSAQSIENWRGWTPGSRNPVLQMVTYMCNPAVPDPAEPDRALGLGLDFETEIAPHLDAWIAAANVCDQSVPKKGGGTEPRYQCDFEYFVGEEPADTLARFLAAFDGWMSETGDGALTVKAGAYDGSAVEINSDWVISHGINRGVPDEQLKNVFVGFYTDPAKKFSQVEGAPWYDQGSIALTGKRRYERVPMTQVQSHGQLTRLLKRIALRRNAEARGTLRLSLPALDLMGERWLKFPDDYPNSEFLRGKTVEVEALEIDFSDGGAVIIDWAIYDTDADTFDPDAEEGAAPPAPSESELSTPPVIDVGDVAALVDTESRFGGQRQAVAVLTFPAPVRSYDIAGAGSVDVPRTDLGWRVRWRIRPDGGWTESAINGDVIEGDEVEGWTVRLRTPDLPRAALDIQIAAVGPRDDQGDWSDSLELDVGAATAPALAAPANVTATAALEESEGGVKRPALTVSFDPITSPEAQMVLVAIKPAGDPDTSFAQIDAIEPSLGGKTIYTIPYGRTVDVGLQTWAQWREPSSWTVVEDVAIPGEVVASDATIPSERMDAARDAINAARGEVTENLSEVNQTLEYAVRRLTEDARLGAQVSLLNRLSDPLFDAGVDGWNAVSGAVLPVAGSPRALQAVWDIAASGRPASQYLQWPVRWHAVKGDFVQVGVEVGVFGVCADIVLEAVWIDAAGDVLSVSQIATGATGRLEGVVEAPADCAEVTIRMAPVATGAGMGGFLVRRPLAASALSGQTSVDLFTAPENELVARLARLERAVGNIAERSRSLQVETRRGRASVRVAEQAIVTEEEARAQLERDVYATLSGDYLTEAQVRETYLAIAGLEDAFAGIDVSVNTTLSGVITKVDGLPADVLSTADANQTFVAISNLEQSISNIDLTANAAFRQVSETVDGLPNDILTEAVADGRFLASADLETALSAIDFTSYASFRNNTSRVVRSTSQPDASLYSAGDVWFNPSSGELRVHNGSTWADNTLATLSYANATFRTQGQVDLQISQFDFSALSFFDELNSSVQVNATALAGLTGASAQFNVVAQASGGEPAAIELISTENGSAVNLVSEQVVIKTSAGGAVKTALKAVDGRIEIPTELRIGANGLIRVAAGGSADPAVLLGQWGSGWGLRCWDGVKWVVDLDPVNQVFLIDGATLKNATIDGLKMVDGAVGSVGRALDDHHDFMVGTNASSAVSFSVKTLTTSAFETKTTDTVEIAVSWTMQAQAGAMNWLYYDVDILRGGTVIWTKEFTHKAGQSVNAVSQNQIGAGDMVPQVISITTEDPSPANTTSATYALRFRPRLVNGAIIEGLNTGLAGTIDLKDMSIIAKAFRSGPFEQ